MRKIKLLSLAALVIGLITFSACKKYSKYDNKEVVENSFTGEIEKGGMVEPDGDFLGEGDSGTYSFVWENAKEKAHVDFDVSSVSSGTCQIILNDAKGKEVFNKTRPEGGNDAFAGKSAKGKEGKWLVTINFVNFDGEGTYNIDPAN